MKCEDKLPPHIELQVRQFGVMAARKPKKVVVTEQTFRRPTFDEHGEPDF